MLHTMNRVFCPECQEAGDRSKVIHHGGTSTLMGWQPYYDEDGYYHSHDPNRTKWSYSCTNGHKWSEKGEQSCPNHRCSWPDE